MLSETEKYSRCYQLPTYHLQGARLERVTRDIEAIPSDATYLDIGCGRGEMIALARRRGVDARGLELVPELCGDDIVHGSLAALPFGDRTAQVVSCYDVVEHLPPDEVDRALDELFRVTDRVLLITTNDKRSQCNGMELHLTRKPRAWWNAKLELRAIDRGGIVKPSDFGRDEWHWRIEF